MESISSQDAKELEKEIVLIHKRLERRKLRMIHSRSNDINSDESPSKNKLFIEKPTYSFVSNYQH